MSVESPVGLLGRSFARHLAAENKAPKTIDTYGEAVKQLVDHLDDLGITDIAVVKREHVESFIVALLQTRAPATANNRFRSLQPFFNWLVDDQYFDGEDEAAARPREGRPGYSRRAASLAALDVPGQGLRRPARRGIIRLLADTGIRRAELVGLTMEDVLLNEKAISVLRKGRRRREAPFGVRTARALDRYERARHGHTHGPLPIPVAGASLDHEHARIGDDDAGS